MKKPGTGSTSKSGLGSIGKSGLGSFGKSGLSSTGKSGIGSSGKSGSVLGSSGKSVLGSSSKSGANTSSSGYCPASKSSLSSSNKGGLSPASKSAVSSSFTPKTSSPKPSKSFDFIPSGKPTSLTPKSYPSGSHDAYSNSKSGKSATFGIIWIPTKKRNKKKDIILTAHNDDRSRRERSPSFYKFMSGDSHDPTYKKEEDLLVLPERKPIPETTAASDLRPENIAASSVDDKSQLLRHDTEESKEAAGDTRDDDNTDDEKDYLNNDEPVRKNLPDTLSEKDAFGDKVDSVYLRAPPSHKARSSPSTPEEESCGMKCLYYTLQCCDCVLM